ncbi:MAG: NAD(P)H-hydrate dehydratase [Candidatus Woesearchaeota archaeon]|nr:MAG: NAD(P)H-hydrate dehydratase [Candidatus Woesearchaeota archaeon]
MINKKILSEVYVKRHKDSHKYQFGSLLVIGGSKRYSGSPALAALAAYRAGVDLVTVAAPERAANIIASFSPDIITFPLQGDYIREEHVDDLIDLAKKSSAVVIGGGMERHDETLNAVAEFLDRVNLTCVIDADAIYAVADNMQSVRRKDFVITPHSREFYVLTNIEPWGMDLKKKMEIVNKLAVHLKTTILLKGPVDIISNGIKNDINRTGCVEMTVGGTGDTLAGIIGSLMAQGNIPFDAACAGAYINGKAGELAAKKLGVSMLATDIIKNISKVIK